MQDSLPLNTTPSLLLIQPYFLTFTSSQVFGHGLGVLGVCADVDDVWVPGRVCVPGQRRGAGHRHGKHPGVRWLAAHAAAWNGIGGLHQLLHSTSLDDSSPSLPTTLQIHSVILPAALDPAAGGRRGRLQAAWRRRAAAV